MEHGRVLSFIEVRDRGLHRSTTQIHWPVSILKEGDVIAVRREGFPEPVTQPSERKFFLRTEQDLVRPQAPGRDDHTLRRDTHRRRRRPIFRPVLQVAHLISFLRVIACGDHADLSKRPYLQRVKNRRNFF